MESSSRVSNLELEGGVLEMWMGRLRMWLIIYESHQKPGAKNLAENFLGYIQPDRV